MIFRWYGMVYGILEYFIDSPISFTLSLRYLGAAKLSQVKRWNNLSRTFEFYGQFLCIFAAQNIP